MWIRSDSHTGNVRSEDPRGHIVLSSQQLLIFFLPGYGGLCPGSWAWTMDMVYAVCVQVLLWRTLVPNTSEQAHANTWDETVTWWNCCHWSSGFGSKYFHFCSLYASSFSFLVINETEQRLSSFKRNIQIECHINGIWCALWIYFHESLQRKTAEVRADPHSPALYASCLQYVRGRLFVFHWALCLSPVSWSSVSFRHSRCVGVLMAIYSPSLRWFHG